MPAGKFIRSGEGNVGIWIKEALWPMFFQNVRQTCCVWQVAVDNGKEILKLGFRLVRQAADSGG